MEFNVISPKTITELLEAVAANQDGNFRFGAGGTDLLMELKHDPSEDLTVVNLAQLEDIIFTTVSKTESDWRIGAMTTAAMILDHDELKSTYPVLWKAAYNLASAQIREVATIGGNLCTASPSGDMACALVALQASCEVLNTKGELRIIPIQDFLTGVRTTDLGKDEVLRSVLLPANEFPSLDSDFIKVGTRLSMECSVVSLAYHVQRDESGMIQKAGIAIGSVAPTVRFVEAAAQYLKGKATLTEKEREEFAAKITADASPISDVRATAWYREQALYNISKAVFEKS